MFLLAWVVAFSTAGSAGTHHLSPHLTPFNQKPNVKFDSIWVNHHIRQGERKGMLIHMKFTVYNMKNVNSEVVIYFRYKDKGPLEGENPEYTDVDGNVAAFKTLKPGYVETVYKDLQVFMPYDELHLDSGRHEVSMQVYLEYGEGSKFKSEHLTYYDFVLIQPYSLKTAKFSIRLDKFWIDYDITENGIYGMRIHAKLVVAKMKGSSSYLAAFFYRQNGTKLLSDNKKFRSESGQMTIFKIIEPKYDESIYDDIRFFLPYSEIKLPAGKHSLSLSLVFLDKNGNRLKTLKEYDFVFTKR